jgi:hypothetical protein
MKADTALMAAATGGVWQGFAPLSTSAPYGLVVQQVGTDTTTMNAVRLFARLTLQIKAVGPSSSYAALVTIADRIDALFGRQGPVALSSGGVLSCYRSSPFAMDELVNGQQWSHLGGLYQIDLQGS